MKLRSTHLLFAAVVLAAIAAGTGALYFLPSLGGRDATASRSALRGEATHLAGGSIMPGLRRAIAPPAEAPTVATPAPAPAEPPPPPPPQSALPALVAVAQPPAAPIAEAPPAVDELQASGVEGVVSFPPIAPTPPARPVDLPNAQAGAPLPPIRPADLASLQAPSEPPAASQPAAAPPQPAPPQAAAQQPAPASSWSFPHWPQAAQPAPETQQASASPAPNYVDAPLPPARPLDLVKSAAPTSAKATPAASAAPEGGQQTARLEEPTLRPAPDDAFQAPPPKFGMGDPVFVRIFKQEGQLELWLKKNGRYALYRTFPICKWSGRLGPKLKEADYQSPEGFYSVSAKQLHPHSNYHRAFNVGYPNAFDRQNGRTGGLVMVHGACKSVGCFAMTDQGIEEIYGFVEAALRAGQKEIPVHIFPFRMTEANITRETGSGGGWLSFVGSGGGYRQWVDFWKNLKQGYDKFEQSGEPPVAFACGDHYEFDGGSASCRRVAGW